MGRVFLRSDVSKAYLNSNKMWDIYPTLSLYICHGRKSNSSTNINLVESPIGVSFSRKSNPGDLFIALGSEI